LELEYGGPQIILGHFRDVTNQTPDCFRVTKEEFLSKKHCYAILCDEKDIAAVVPIGGVTYCLWNVVIGSEGKRGRLWVDVKHREDIKVRRVKGNACIFIAVSAGLM